MKLILFDCDGTLVDSQHMICAAMHHAYTAHGLPTPPRDRLLGIVGLSLEEAFQQLAGKERHPIVELTAHYRAAFGELRRDGRYDEALFPGAREIIEDLAHRPDTALGIVTGKSQRGVRAVLGAHGLYDHFLTIQTAEDAPSKPHPAMVQQAMRAIGGRREDTVVVGDTVYDIAMAKAAGVAAIGVAWGYHRSEALREAGAVDVIAAFEDLLPALERHWAAGEPRPESITELDGVPLSALPEGEG